MMKIHPLKFARTNSYQISDYASLFEGQQESNIPALTCLIVTLSLVLPVEEGSVGAIKISPNEKYVAVATNKGIVSIVQLEVTSKYLHVSQDHCGYGVTCLCWSSSSDNLYIGDDKGKVTSINISLKQAHSIFNASTQLIVRLDHKVVQLDINDNYILISCLNATVLCDITRQKYSKIGTKIRDGPFGSCFYMGKIFCARPGQRLWEVDFKGRVLFTHQLKPMLSMPPTAVINIDNDAQVSLKNSSSPQGVNFNQLLVVCKRFIVTWGNRYIFVFDPPTNGLILWSSFESEIKDVRVIGCEIFVHFLEGNFKHIYLLSVMDGVHKLIKNSQWELAANLCNLYKNQLYSSSSKIQKNHLQLLLDHLSLEEQISKDIAEIIKKLEELYPPAEVNANTTGYKIESGIFVVNRPENVTSKKIDYSSVSNCTTNDERGTSFLLEPYLTSGVQMGMVMPFIDPDFSSLGFDAISALRPNVSFGDLKSKYNIGKEKILTTMGHLEDRIKGAHASSNQPLLDVRTLETDNLNENQIGGESVTYLKIDDKHMPLHLQNLLDVCQDHWIRVLNTTVINHYKYSKNLDESRMQKSVSCDNLTLPLKIHRRNSFLFVRRDHTLDGRSLEDFYLYETVYNNKKKSDIFDWLQKWHTFQFNEEGFRKLSQLTSLCFLEKVFGQISEYAELSYEKESEDYACSLFIHLYFNLLNPHSVRIELERNLEKLFTKSWMTLVDCVTDMNEHPVEFTQLIQCYKLILKGKRAKNLLQHLLQYLKKTTHMVTPRDIYYLDSYGEFHGLLLMNFMDDANEKHFFRACDDLFVSKLWIQSTLQTNFGICSETHQCQCGIPKAGSHKCRNERFDILQQIIRNSKITKDMRETFKDYGYWYGYMYACHKASCKSEVLKTLVHLSDIELFKDPSNAALLPQTDDEWNFQVHQKTRYPGGVNHYVWAQIRSYASADIRRKLLSETFNTPDIPVIECKDDKCNWGVGIDLKSLCFNCLLPLIVPLKGSASGIRVFRCGHSFHLSCVENDDAVCYKCKTTSHIS
ncbi:Hermansky-Pudlak syndrome 5 [Chamberlinius hualienensis]